MVLNKSTFAKLNKVSRAAITLAVKSGALIENDHGMIDDQNQVNVLWLERRTVKKTKKEKPAKTPTVEKPKKIPEQKKEVETLDDVDIDELPDDEMSFDDMGALSITKLKAEIRFKTEQSDTALQKRLERLGQLIEREQVERAMGNLGAELKLRLLELPARITPAICAMVRSGTIDNEIQKYFEAEISQAIQEIKKRTIEATR